MPDTRLRSESILSELLAENARLQEELAQSEARYRFLAEGLPIYVWYGEQGGMEYCNQNLLDFTGLTIDQIRAGESLKLIHRDDVVKLLIKTKESLETGQPFSQEYRIRRHDGEYRWHLAHSRRFTDSQGRTKWLGTSIDITERKVAEQALHTTNERFSLALETAKMGDWEWDIESNAVQWSEAVQRMHGFKPGTFDGYYESWAARLHPEDRERIVEGMRLAIKDSQHYEADYRTVRDGTECWILMRGVVLRHTDGSPDRMLGVCMDVTSSKQAEEALRRAEKLAAVGRLAASISHEINNPLEAVTNLLYILRNRDDLKDDTKSLVATAEQELSRVTQIVTQTLRFYKQSTNRSWVDVNLLLDSVLTLFQGRLSAARVEVVRDFRSTQPVFCFDGELRQLFANLVSNAVDAMSVNGGRLTLRTRDTAHHHSGLGGVRVMVADTGCGMDRDTQAHIFEPFFTTKPATGTGLGLWVSQEILRKHKAAMTLRSRNIDPTGTLFSVFLPLGENELGATKNPAP